MKNMLAKMLEKLSDEDKLIFSQLAENLNKVDGDVTKLSDKEMALIKKMEEKYEDKLSGFTELTDPVLNQDEDASGSSYSENDLLNSGFAEFSRKILSRDLKEQFPKEEDAIKFAFQNKWLPQDFKEDESANKIFLEFEQDISEANQWREDVVGIDADKKMAVGMTWFMMIYQLHHR